MTIEDLPHFIVSTVTTGNVGENGEVEYELSGVFDKTSGVNEGQCWMLLPEREVLIALTGNLKLLEPGKKTALYQTSKTSMPDVVGSKLAYLEPRWEPYQVWMVIEPRWKWERVLFHAGDAIGKKIKGSGVSIVDGQEVTEWIEVKSVGPDSHLTRYYPIFPDERTTLPPTGPDGVIKGGWTHAHCEICSGHVVAESYGYIDAENDWVCETCYSRYVANHDISFLKS